MNLFCIYTVYPRLGEAAVCARPAQYLVDGNSLCQMHLLTYRENGHETEEHREG